MDYSTIVTNSNKLKKTSLYKVTIADSTREQLITINSEIMRAHEAGRSYAELRLPIHFKQIDGDVSNEEIQLCVYTNIIDDLVKKGYEVKLRLGTTTTRLVVSWAVRAPKSHIELMRRKVAENSF